MKLVPEDVIELEKIVDTLLAAGNGDKNLYSSIVDKMENGSGSWVWKGENSMTDSELLYRTSMIYGDEEDMNLIYMNLRMVGLSLYTSMLKHITGARRPGFDKHESESSIKILLSLFKLKAEAYMEAYDG